MNQAHPTRRQFIRASSTLFGAAVLSKPAGSAPGFETPNERPTIGVIGCGIRWDKRVFVPDGRYGVGKEFPKFGDIITVCDVDAHRLDRAKDVVKGWLEIEEYEKLPSWDARRRVSRPSIKETP